MEDETEFLELSARQRRAVDRAFERGVRSVKGRPSKRRRLDTSAPTTGTATPAGEDGGGFIDDGGGFIPEDGGGFMDDGGGFVPDDDAGGFIPDDGGFVPDDDAGGFIPDEGGGFVPEDSGPSAGPSAGPSTTRASRVTSTDAEDRLPLTLMPTLLRSLRLPSDEDVLSVFRAMNEDGVRREDFRAVCAALMPPDGAAQGEGDDQDLADGEGGGDGNDWDMSSGSASEAFEPSDDDDEDFGAPPKRGKAAAKTRRAKALEDTGVARLSARQREGARALWALIKPDAKSGGILSRDEVKRWVRELGEMWSDAEITDMVTLFSGQHEGRGLTFEDFGVVMMRAGLV